MIKKNIMVLLATYNGELYLEKQLNSIFNQEGVNVSVLARDDGSTDKTLNILRKYSEENTLLLLDSSNDEQHGAMHNFYTLIDYAKRNFVSEYDFFAFSDQDDIWDLRKIDVMSKQIENFDIPKLAYCNYRVIDEEDQIVIDSADEQIGLKPDGNETLLFTNSFAWGHSIVFNATLLNNINIDKDVISSGFPHDVYFAKYAVITHGLVYIPNALVSYRRYKSNVSDIWYKFSIKKAAKQLKSEKLIYANVVNGSLFTFSKNKLSRLVDKKMIENAQNVIENGGFRSVRFFIRKGVYRKQKSRTAALYCIYFFKIYQKLLYSRKKLVIK